MLALFRATPGGPPRIPILFPLPAPEPADGVGGWREARPLLGDRSKIVFDSDRDGPVAVFAMDADGSDPVNLSKPKRPGDIFPSWSPDGSKIVYTCGPSFEGLDICVIDSDGGRQRDLTGDPGTREWEPMWSPDGTKIAFVSNRTGDDEVYVMDVNGGRITRLTRNAGRDADLAWSPGGTKIAFDSDREGPLSIFVMDASGANLTRLIESPGADASPSWSPMAPGSRSIARWEMGAGSSSSMPMDAISAG
jgi:Tol biopolymer transport system component